MTSQSSHRSWPQRLTLGVVIVAAFACFAAAGVFATGQWVLSQRKLVTLQDATTVHNADAASDRVVMPGDTTTSTTIVTAEPGVTTTSLPLAEPDAANFLITGADNGDCADQGDVTVGDRGDIGERSDTIMIWRVNPATNQLAVLSLPRDLYVDIAGGRRARINSAYRRDDPSRLIDTIKLNFGISIDHYIQVDFCAFRRLVEAVGGVEVPFEFPAKDVKSGLFIAEAGCVNLDGDMALAYVRSRSYRYEDPPGSGNWKTDGTSDFGRIARQQDFLRRVVAKVIAEGLYKPNVATALIETNRDFVVSDAGLTLGRMLEFANTLRTLNPAEITTYRIESFPDVQSGQQVEIPSLKGDNMQAILAVFRGEATLATAPDQVFEIPTATTVLDDEPDTATPDDDQLPVVVAEENLVGVAPNGDVQCN